MTELYHATQLPLFTLSKACTKCHKEKDIEDFPVDRSKPTGCRTACRVCWNTYERAQTAHSSEAHHAYERARRARNHEHCRVLDQLQYLKHREKRLAENREWNRCNKLTKVEIRMRYNARKKQARIGEVSYGHVLERCDYWCYICEQAIDPQAKGVASLAFDHVIPLARGGVHAEDNIRPVHKICNSRKRAMLIREMSAFDRRGMS